MKIKAFNWKEQSKRLLKSELVKKGINTEELSQLLKNIGVNETKASIDNKLSRGSFSFIFYLQCKYILDNFYNYDNVENVMMINDISIQYKIFDSMRITEFYPIFFHKRNNTAFLDIESDSNTRLYQNKVVSLFTGAGGFDIGLEMSGFETVSCIEIDEDSRETLRHNRPQWKLFEENNNRNAGDIRKIRVEEFLEFSNITKCEPALVIGGAPCQPFSNIGKKNGINDPRNGDLFLEFVRFVKGILPQAFIFENVVGITQSKHNDVIKYMKEKLAGLGYEISYTILNSANYGVPQKRLRFFLLGIKGVENPAFPLPTHYSTLKEWQQFISDLDKTPKYLPKPYVTLQEAFSKLPKNLETRNDYALMNISDIVKGRMKLIKQGENFKVLPLDMRPNCWKNGKHQGQDTFGRLKLSEPSVTIRTAAYNPAKGKYIHPIENRGLNTIEMAAIQSFPENWEIKCKNRERVTLVGAGRQIGNAVPPLLAKALGDAVKLQLIM